MCPSSNFPHWIVGIANYVPFVDDGSWIIHDGQKETIDE